MQEDKQKQEVSNRRNFSFRLNFFFFVIFGLFSALIIQLAILQFVEGPTLSKQGMQKGQRTAILPPIRGNIYDSTGQPIAYSTSTQSLYFTIQPGQTNEDFEKLAAKLDEVFTKYGNPDKAIDLAEIVSRMDLQFRQNYMSTPRRIKTDLTNDEIAYFMENRNHFKGISILEESVRNYSSDTIAVQLVGYLKKFKGARGTYSFYKEKGEITDPKFKYHEDENVGAQGLEYMYQDVLRGNNGIKSWPVDKVGKVIGPVEIDTYPQKGADLFLTINKEVQLRTEEAIMTHVEQISKSKGFDKALYAQSGYAVAMEVNTGKVIAMASMPDYDPNVWSGGSISDQDYEKYKHVMNNGTISPAWGYFESDKERAKHSSSILPLGSTVKPLTVLIGLSEGVITPGTKYRDTGFYKFGRAGHESIISNSGNKANGTISPAQAIGVSSNTFMSEMIGNRLYMKTRTDGQKAVDVWNSYMEQFGLGVPTGSGLINESKGVIDLYNEAASASSQSALIRASFGQLDKYTTLQLTQYTAMLANRGKRMKPQFVNEIRASDGTLIEDFKPEVLNEVDFPKEYWDVVHQGMLLVKVQGFDGVNYSFARKTGTSEQLVSGRKANNAVFIAYAPAEKPKLAVAVVVPDGGFGAYGAAPIARQIFDAYDEEIGLYSE